MNSPVVATVTKMLESLPPELQKRVEEHLREYIQNLLDEAHWDALYEASREQLVAAAREAKAEFAEGKAEPLDFSRL